MSTHKTKLSLTDMTLIQFRKWLSSIVDETLFAVRDKLVVLLAHNADREALAEGFRELFESYSYDFAFELDAQEENVLCVLEEFDKFAYLKGRVDAVVTERKTSHHGRMMRRFGGMPNIGGNEIKVETLSDADFCLFMETLVNSELFAAREQVVKLMKEPISRANHSQLKAAFYEFFVCHLELEQFFEGYAYDPDEELEIQPKIAEEVDRSIDDYYSGTIKGKSIEEVVEELGLI